MALRFRCSACSQLYRVPDSMGGRTIHCFSCGQAVIAATKNRVADDALADQAAGEIIINGPTSSEPQSLESLGLELVEGADDAPLKMAVDDAPLPMPDEQLPEAPLAAKAAPSQKPAVTTAKPKVVVSASRTSDKGHAAPATNGAPSAQATARTAAVRPTGAPPQNRTPQPSSDIKPLTLHDIALAAGDVDPPPAPSRSPARQHPTSRHSPQSTRSGHRPDASDALPNLDALAQLSTGKIIANATGVPTNASMRAGPNPFLSWMRSVGVRSFVDESLLRNGWAWLALGILTTWCCMWTQRTNVLPMAVWLAWVSGIWGWLCFLIASVKATGMNRQTGLFLPAPLVIAMIVLGKFFPVADFIRAAIFVVIGIIATANCSWKLLQTPRSVVLRHWFWLGTSVYFLALCLGAIGVLMNAGQSVWPPTAAGAGGQPASAQTCVVSNIPPSFGPRNPEVLAAATTAGTGASGQSVRLWLYLPSSQAGQRQSLGCVFIAPAGSTCFTGMNLSPDDETEILPYVRAGFAVAAYDLEGPLRDTQSPTNREVAAAMKAFIAADGGLADARMAIEYALKWVPEIDPSRLYAAGHSSAGTVAILLTASDARIKACLAYAPCSDLEARLQQAPALGRLVSGTEEFARGHSPMNVADRLACPVFLFHANDDANVPVSQSRELRTRSRNIEIITVSSGGHFDAYIQEGLPAGVAWLKSRDTQLASTRSVQAPVAQPLPQPGVANPPIVSNPGRPNIFENTPPAAPPQPTLTDRAIPATTDPPVPERPTPAVGPAIAPTPTNPPAAVRPGPVVPPAVTPPSVRPAPVVDTTPRGQLSRLGADVTTNPDAEIMAVDLRRVTDVAGAAGILAGFKRIATLRLLPSQFTPDAMLALKAIPSITRLDFTDIKLVDTDLARVAILSNVDELNLAGQPITAAGIRAISTMTNLKRLYLKGTKIDDTACQHLAKLSSLRHLDLADTHITSEGVEQLKPLRNLVGLVLSHTDVSDAAQQNLKLSNPRINIIPP